jgi:hypothetical protein
VCWFATNKDYQIQIGPFAFAHDFAKVSNDNLLVRARLEDIFISFDAVRSVTKDGQVFQTRHGMPIPIVNALFSQIALYGVTAGDIY